VKNGSCIENISLGLIFKWNKNCSKYSITQGIGGFKTLTCQ